MASTRNALVQIDSHLQAYEGLADKLAAKALTNHPGPDAPPKMSSNAPPALINPARGGLSLVPAVAKAPATESDYIELHAEHGVAAIKQDVQKGDKWSAQSIGTWKRLFSAAAAEPNATETSVFLQMKSSVAAINKSVGGDRVRIAVTKSQNIASYYIVLSKDQTHLLSNNLTIARGTESAAVTKLGTFGRTKLSK